MKVALTYILPSLLFSASLLSQTTLKPSQLLDCRNWQDAGVVTRVPLQQAVLLRDASPDLTIFIPGYAPFTVRITKAGTDEGNGNQGGSLIVELPSDGSIILRASAFMEAIVVSGAATMQPNRTDGFWEDCNSQRVPSFFVHACGFTWSVSGCRAASSRGQRGCIHGVPQW
jgi:hypothetical protein